MFKTIKMPFYNTDLSGGGDDLKSGKTFSQEDVDRIVGERLTREKASKVDYDDLKEVTELVKAFGYEGSAADIKTQLKQEAEARTKAKELEDAKKVAERDGISPELAIEIKQLKDELAEIKKEKSDKQKDMELKQSQQIAWDAQVKDFQEKHVDVDLEKLSSNEKFMKFLSKSNPSITLVDVYDTYVDLVGGAEKAAIEKIKSNSDRSTFSGKDKKDATGGTYGLTERQQNLAKENGMTFKEYSDLQAHTRK